MAEARQHLADLLAARPGLAAATGSACHEGTPDPLGRWTTETEIEQAAAILAASVPSTISS